MLCSGQVPIPPPSNDALPAYVVGGTDDWIVDVDGVRELAAWCGVQPVLFDRMAHDMMLVRPVIRRKAVKCMATCGLTQCRPQRQRSITSGALMLCNFTKRR